MLYAEDSSILGEHLYSTYYKHVLPHNNYIYLSIHLSTHVLSLYICFHITPRISASLKDQKFPQFIQVHLNIMEL